VIAWRLDRWGRSVADLVSTLQEVQHLGVGRAMAGLLAVFSDFEREILRERVRTGLAHARERGKRLGRPQTATLHASQVGKLYRAGVSNAEIARRLQIGRPQYAGFWLDQFPRNRAFPKPRCRPPGNLNPRQDGCGYCCNLIHCSGGPSKTGARFGRSIRQKSHS